MKKKKRPLVGKEFLFAVLSIIIVLIIVSRGIPDGAARLDLGDSGIGEKAIALTFDGTAGQYTKELIDALAPTGAKVTFFVYGEDVSENSQTFLRACDEGHMIGNLTYDSKPILFMGKTKAKESINKTAKIISDEIGIGPYFVRIPTDFIGSFQLKALDCFFVSASSSVYDKGDYTADDVYNKLIRHAKDGEIIRLNINSQSTVEGVLRAVEKLQKEGFEFVRVDDLLTRNGDRLARGMLYRKCGFDASPIAF